MHDHVRVEYRDRVKMDSVYFRDSVYIKEFQRGDTVRITEYRDRWRYITKVQRDTVSVSDTVRVEVVKTIEPYVSPFARFKMRAFWALAVFALIAVAGIVFAVWRKIKKDAWFWS